MFVPEFSNQFKLKDTDKKIVYFADTGTHSDLFKS